MLTYFLVGLAMGLVPYVFVIGAREAWRRSCNRYYRDILDIALTKVAISVSEYHNAITAWRSSGLEILRDAAKAIDGKAPGSPHADFVKASIIEGENIEMKLPSPFTLVKGGKA